ncbi:3-hydroxyacyl-ACP dehydratase FabZ [Acinetobacter seifertii]|nr:3-hydroxyacyl-ACP dehydratase FabZ [Acinetobacter seifertii]
MTESTTPKFAIPELPMQIQTIRQYLPHRYPFLLVDRVTEVTDNSIVGYKNVSINEEFLQGHFQNIQYAWCLIVEALAQVSGVLGFIMNNETPKPGFCSCLLVLKRVRFKKQVVAGDQLVLKSELVMQQQRGIYKYNCTASVDGIVAATAEIMISHQKTEQA